MATFANSHTCDWWIIKTCHLLFRRIHSPEYEVIGHHQLATEKLAFAHAQRRIEPRTMFHRLTQQLTESVPYWHFPAMSKSIRLWKCNFWSRSRISRDQLEIRFDRKFAAALNWRRKRHLNELPIKEKRPEFVLLKIVRKKKAKNGLHLSPCWHVSPSDKKCVCVRVFVSEGCPCGQ